jgi:hypothetical protein
LIKLTGKKSKNKTKKPKTNLLNLYLKDSLYQVQKFELSKEQKRHINQMNQKNILKKEKKQKKK